MQENVCIIYIFGNNDSYNTTYFCIFILDTFTISYIHFFEKNRGNGDYMKYLL